MLSVWMRCLKKNEIPIKVSRLGARIRNLLGLGLGLLYFIQKHEKDFKPISWQITSRKEKMRKKFLSFLNYVDRNTFKMNNIILKITKTFELDYFRANFSPIFSKQVIILCHPPSKNWNYEKKKYFSIFKFDILLMCSYMWCSH